MERGHRAIPTEFVKGICSTRRPSRSFRSVVTVFALLSLSAIRAAAEEDIRHIESTGVAPIWNGDVEDARAAARKIAMRNAVSTAVDAENRDDAFVSSVRVVDSRREGDTWVVRIDAEVRLVDMQEMSPVNEHITPHGPLIKLVVLPSASDATGSEGKLGDLLARKIPLRVRKMESHPDRVDPARLLGSNPAVESFRALAQEEPGLVFVATYLSTDTTGCSATARTVVYDVLDERIIDSFDLTETPRESERNGCLDVALGALAMRLAGRVTKLIRKTEVVLDAPIPVQPRHRNKPRSRAACGRGALEKHYRRLVEQNSGWSRCKQTEDYDALASAGTCALPFLAERLRARPLPPGDLCLVYAFVQASGHPPAEFFQGVVDDDELAPRVLKWWNRHESEFK